MENKKESFKHISVLADELVKSINLTQGSFAIDCTAGGGGHSAKILNKISDSGKLLALDQDLDAISHLEKKFSSEIAQKSLILEHTPFSNLKKVALEQGFFEKTAAIIADIGVSSHQIDTATRGFSFQQNGPLDMRMDQEKNPLTAQEVINSYPETELTKILYKYGQEPHAKRIVSNIIKERDKKEITTTNELCEIIKKAIPYKYSKKNPATKTFQALRIYINKELQQLEELLEQSFACLKKGGRLAIITFHSLEDKIVKDFFKKLCGKKIQDELPREIPFTQTQVNDYNKVRGKIIKPFPITPSPLELAENPRARSAKLRVVEKLE